MGRKRGYNVGSWVFQRVDEAEAVLSVDKFLAIMPGKLDGASDEEIEAALGDVMEILLGCDEVEDPSIDFDRGTGEVEIEVILEADDPLDCMQKVSGIIRAAVHGAGIATPNWPTAADVLGHVATILFEHGPRLEPVGAPV